MASDLHIDFETRSTLDLKKVGVHAYAAHPSTDLWCACYSFDDGPVERWHPRHTFPPRDIQDHVESGGRIYAHNSAFERTIWRLILAPRYGWPLPAVEQWYCTMAMALAMSLPASLDQASRAVSLPFEKDEEGHRLMMRMCRPRSAHPVDGTVVWWDVPEKVERLTAYCTQDVVVERALGDRLVPLRESEQRLWWLDQRINDRGVYVDDEFCEAAKIVVADTVKRLNARMKEVTGGAVSGVTKVADIVAFLWKQGVLTKSIAKGELADLLTRSDLPPAAREVLELRQEGGKASVAKINALLRGRCPDGRARGLIQYHAASTGRWGGRRFQPQNLKRPDETTDVPAAIEAIREGIPSRAIEWAFGPPLDIVGDCIRGMVVAEPGNKFYVADFVSIEGVVLPWLAGEEWKLDAFRAYRRGDAPDLYIQSYCKTFGVPLFGKKDPRRQVGKVMELASGFQGGHGAYLRMGASGKRLDELTVMVRANTDKHVWAEATDKYKKGANGLERDQWTALRIVIDAWRAAHPCIKQFWFDLEEAAITAVREPGKTFCAGDFGRPVRYKKQGSFLWCQLPSGRALCYPYPRLENVLMPWGKQKLSLVCKGVDPLTKQWCDQKIYGGLLAENVTQAVARDLLAEGIERCEAAGYATVLHVHDENVAEVREGFGSLEDFVAIMEVVPAWAVGCPIAAEGWEGTRYKK